MYLKYNCPILFVGINPSLANVGSEEELVYFGGNRNQFYKLVEQSGKMPERVQGKKKGKLIRTALIEGLSDRVLKDNTLHTEYGYSFMNYVDHPTQSEKDIRAEELLEGKERLDKIMKEYQPLVICFVGKKCCKFSLYLSRSNNQVESGLQSRQINDVPFFCIPDGSKKGTQWSFDDKLVYYKALADYLKK